MNIKKAAVYLFGGLYLVFFSSACCGTHPGPNPEDPKGPNQEQQTETAAPAVSEESVEMTEEIVAEETAGGEAAVEEAVPPAEGEVVEGMVEPAADEAEVVEEMPAAQ